VLGWVIGGGPSSKQMKYLLHEYKTRNEGAELTFMMTFLYLTGIFLAILLLEFLVEGKLQLRSRTVKKLGIVLSVILMIIALTSIHLVFVSLWPGLEHNKLFTYAMIGLMVFLLPKKWDIANKLSQK
jgi:hypothetical protein